MQAFLPHHMHLAALQAAQHVQFVFQPFGILQHMGGMAGKQLSGRRELQAAAQALEQREAQFLLQLYQLSVDGRGIDEQLARGAAYRSVAADGVEIEQAPGVNMHGGLL